MQIATEAEDWDELVRLAFIECQELEGHIHEARKVPDQPVPEVSAVPAQCQFDAAEAA